MPQKFQKIVPKKCLRSYKILGRGLVRLVLEETQIKAAFLRLSNCRAMVMAPPIVGVSI